MFSFLKRRKAQKACDAFNKANPVGTRVIIIGCSLLEHQGLPPDCFTYGDAFVFGNVAVAGITGHPLGYPLDQLCVMPPRKASAYSAKARALDSASYHRQADSSGVNTSSFTDDFSSPAYFPAAHRPSEPAIVSGGGGDFGGGGASSSWSSNDDSSSSSSDSGSSSSSSSD